MSRTMHRMHRMHRTEHRKSVYGGPYGAPYGASYETRIKGAKKTGNICQLETEEDFGRQIDYIVVSVLQFGASRRMHGGEWGLGDRELK